MVRYTALWRQNSGIATTGSGCVSVGWDPGMLVGNLWCIPLAIVFASASLPTVPVLLVRVGPPSVIATLLIARANFSRCSEQVSQFTLFLTLPVISAACISCIAICHLPKLQPYALHATRSPYQTTYYPSQRTLVENRNACCCSVLKKLIESLIVTVIPH